MESVQLVIEQIQKTWHNVTWHSSLHSTYLWSRR